MHADDGIVLRLPDVDDEDSARSVMDLITIEPEEVEALVTAEVGGSALFASRFRECAARALLLPRRRPDRRTPLWQQRQRSAHLLGVASDFASFPIILETVRECLQDVYDVPALREIQAELRDGRIRVHEAATDQPSPFAQSLLFGYVASFIYEGDSPLAERRAQALTLDPGLLAELLGSPELRDLLDADALDEVEAELQRLTPTSRARDLEDAADLLRILGPLSDAEAAARGIEPDWLASLCSDRRAIRIRTAGDDRTAAIEDAGRLRDALGIALPVGIPDAHLAIVADPLGDVVGRYARTHGPFTAEQAAAGLGLPPGVAREVLSRLASSGRLVRGEFRPLAGAAREQGSSHTEYCDVEVLRRIRRRSIAKLRHEIEPVPPARYAAFLPKWQRVSPTGARSELRGVDGCYEVIEQLAGTALPASTWLRSVLPARVDDVHDGMLDELIGSGDVVWWGVSALSGGDGIVCLAPTDRAPLLRRPPASIDDDPAAVAVADALGAGGALFFRDLADRVGAGRSGGPLASDADLVEALWRLVWAGAVTNDGWSALRARISGARPRTPARRGRPGLPQRSGPPAGAGRWSLLPTLSTDPTSGATAMGQALLDRHGIVTRGTVVSERIDGGFARMYRVLTAFEDAGRCRRTYAIEGLGASQFALPSAVDRLRATPRSAHVTTVLAATDPANAYGAALPWPALAVDVSHRPGRKAGAIVVVVDGELALYLERGGKSLLVWDHPDDLLAMAATALVRDGQRLGMDRAVIAKVNGATPTDDHARLLAEAGFLPTPRGLRPPRH